MLKFQKIITFVFFLPFLALAQAPTQYIINYIAPTGQRTIIEIVETVLSWLVLLGFPIVGIFIIWSGVKFLTAGGDETKISDAKRMFLYSLIGGAIIFASFIIVNTIALIIVRKHLNP